MDINTAKRICEGLLSDIEDGIVISKHLPSSDNKIAWLALKSLIANVEELEKLYKTYVDRHTNEVALINKLKEKLDKNIIDINEYWAGIPLEILVKSNYAEELKEFIEKEEDKP